MKAMTLQDMEALLAAHEQAEFDMDLDATMATLVDNPVYELPSMGWRIEGYDAVLETYRRMFPGTEHRGVWADKRVHAISDSELCREAYVYFDTPDGRVTGQYFVVVAFKDGKIAGERMYMDTTFAKMFNEIMGEDFGDVPGVYRLADKVPAPVPRFDRAAEHAANSNH